MGRRSAKGKDDLGALRRSVEQGERAPFYLLYGEEEFEREETWRWLMRHWAPPVAADFNVDRFSAERLDLEAFAKTYQAYPMMAPHRLVLLRDCEKLSADHCQKLEDLGRNPVPSTTLIAVGAKVDMRRTLFREMGKSGRAVRFTRLYDNQVPQWINQRSKRLGVKLDERAVALLRLYIGPNLRELANEIEKLSVFVGEGETITGDAVEEGVGGSRHNNIFALTEAVGAGQKRKALVLLRRQMAAGEEPLRILALLSRHFQLVLKAQDCLQLPKEEAAKKLGVSPFFLADYLQQARRMSRSLLWNRLAALLRAEVRLKSAGRRQEPLSMDLLLHELC